MWYVRLGIRCKSGILCKVVPHTSILFKSLDAGSTFRYFVAVEQPKPDLLRLSTISMPQVLSCNQVHRGKYHGQTVILPSKTLL